MDNESTKAASAAPPSPRLVAPREAAIVNSRAVTFKWHPVEEATRYRIEVASDTAFEELLFEKEVPGERTALKVTDVFRADEQMFFWRVLSQGENGWSPGERVESFVGGTPEDVNKHIQVPDEEEQLGPLEGLMHSASDMVVEELSGHDAEARHHRFEKEQDQGVAFEGIPSAQVMGIALSTLVAVALIVVVLFQWTNITTSAVREAAVDPADYTLLQQTEQEAARKLSQYEALPEQEGTYRIPIDRAMELVVEETSQQGDRTYSSDAPFVSNSQ